MAINWGTGTIPLTGEAPQSGLSSLAQGVEQGAKAAVAPGMATSGLQIQQAQANAAPGLLDLQQQVMKSGLKTADIENATKTYTMAQNILAPSMMAMRDGDMESAANIYNNGYKALQDAGLDPAKVGAPSQFDPKFVQYAFSNVSQQLDMMKQMMAMNVQQSDISRNQSAIDLNSLKQKEIEFSTGIQGTPQPTGAFTFTKDQPVQSAPLPGSIDAPAATTAPTAAPIANLSPKAKQEIATEQAKNAIKNREALATQANAARGNVNLINEAIDILDKNPKTTGRIGAVTQYTHDSPNRLGAIYDQLKLNKIGTDYANQGLGPLDVAVAKILFATTASVSDPAANQRLSLQNSLVAAKGIMMNNEIASKLNAARMYDENVRAQIGAEIAAKLNIKEGGTINLQNFKNSDKVIDTVLAKHGIGKAPPEEKSSVPSRADLISSGANPAQVDAYLASLPKKA